MDENYCEVKDSLSKYYELKDNTPVFCLSLEPIRIPNEHRDIAASFFFLLVFLVLIHHISNDE